MATKPDKILIRQIQMRRDTLENWELINPVLADGEFGVERTPGAGDGEPSQFKIGNGVSTWTALAYAGLIGPAGTDGKDGIDGVDGVDGKDGVFAISPLPNNRATTDPDNNSLYVPELNIDLVDIYTRVKADEILDLSNLAPSELALAQLTVATGTDAKEVTTALDKVVLKKIAGQDLSALTCVYERDGVVFKLDYRDSANIDYFLGITITAADKDGLITVQRLGQMTDSFWNFTLNRVYVGIDGVPTQTPPEDGYDVLIGMATTPKSIVLNIQDPIELEN